MRPDLDVECDMFQDVRFPGHCSVCVRDRVLVSIRMITRYYCLGFLTAKQIDIHVHSFYASHGWVLSSKLLQGQNCLIGLETYFRYCDLIQIRD